MNRLRAWLEKCLAAQDAKRARRLAAEAAANDADREAARAARVRVEPVFPYPLPRVLPAIVLAVMLGGTPSSAQNITCSSQPNGQTICEPTARPRAARLAIVAAVAAGVAVAVYLVHRHRHPAASRRGDTNPKPAPNGARRSEKGCREGRVSEYFLLLDLHPQGGTHPPQYLGGKYPTLANAEAGVREYCHDRGLL